MLKKLCLHLLFIPLLFIMTNQSFAMSGQAELNMKDGRTIYGTIKGINP